MSAETKAKMSASASKARSATWQVISPNGEVHITTSLKDWCNKRGLSYFTVWGNRDGFRVNKIYDPNENATVRAEGYVHIVDLDTGEVLVSKSNAIHFENFSEAIAQSLANRPTGHIHEMAFGNGASTVSGTGAVTYFPPNVTGQSAQLYNQTYAKVVDDMSPLNPNPSYNNLRVQHAQNSTFSDIVVTCTLAAQEPSDQGVFDNEVNNETPYVFDELGLKAFDPAGNGKLLTHVIFHPVQKSLNRAFEIIYTVRIYMS